MTFCLDHLVPEYKQCVHPGAPQDQESRESFFQTIPPQCCGHVARAVLKLILFADMCRLRQEKAAPAEATKPNKALQKTAR